MQIKQIGDHKLLYVMAAAPEYGEHLQERFVPLMTGIGPVEAAVVLSAELGRLNEAGELPDLIVSLGSAGSAKLPQTEVYQVSSVCYRDMDASSLGFEKGQTPLLEGTTAPAVHEPHDFTTPELPIRRTCLYEEHLKLTQKRFLVPFAGWEMPVWYEGIGAEHRAVRLGAGLFDVSHMGVLAVRGRHAERFLDLVTTNYVPWLAPGQCH